MPMPRAGQAAIWIKNHLGFKELTRDEQNEAGSFGFIWGIFELYVMTSLGKKSSAPFRANEAKEFAASEFIMRKDLSDEKQFFRNRFFAKDGSDLPTWASAHWRPSDNAEEIRALLLKNDTSFEEDAEVLMRVVLRLRNNLFHGVKWSYGMKGQLENFTHANSVLTKILPQM